MFCKNCGKIINDEASFCPYCGISVIKEEYVMNKIPASNNNLVRKKKRRFHPFLIVIVMLLLIFPVKTYIEKAIVKSIAEGYLQMVKDGPDEETMDEIVVKLLYEFTGSNTLTKLLHSQITGEDICDLYDAVMLHMNYEVKSVEKVESGHYRITVRVENMNNITVASEAWKIFSKRYTDGNVLDAIKQAKDDLLSDKSTMISGFITEASNDLYEHDRIHSMVAGIHMIDVIKTDDGWKPSFQDGVDTFIFDCAGIPY